MTVKVEKAETVPPERIPLGIPFLVLVQFVNLHKARFKAPPELKEAVKECLHALLRGWISNRPYDFILNCQQSAETIWGGAPAYTDPNHDPAKNRPAYSGLKDDPEIKALEENWGVRIVENGVKIMDVGFTEEYQSDIALREEKRLKAEALSKQVEVLVELRMAKARSGGDIAAFRALLAGDDQLKQKYEEKCESLTNRLLAQEDGSYFETHGGLLADLMAFATHWEEAKVAAQGGARHLRGPRGNRPTHPGGNPPQGPQGP